MRDGTGCASAGAWRLRRYDLNTQRYFDIADRSDPSHAEKLASYCALADGYFEVDRYHDFCASRLAHLDEVVLDGVEGADFDRLLVDTVRSTFPAHEHEHFIAHYPGLLGAWARDESGRQS